ncbi:hypothetical protein FFWV33_07090 [Flavobacterium faecale]|uniref:Outer membrane protein beta-barrel domain-containing protein n=1 Tax=Flavobacterium faecale TaxID=1355330 RepID=A0A2S1LC69_9FLAO|nr:hypothetical protein [Flavobacterium faecale]AWG21311.1 hypothetical protein FFWV33_07090 [Flavobacterium faecale]
MRKITFGLLLLLCGIAASAQEISVEEKMYGVELGIVKADVFYEFKLDRKWVLRTELAAELGSYSYFDWDGGITDGTIIPVSVVVEPRFYYGIDRRNRLGRNIAHNSSNFFSLKTSFSANRIPLYKTEDNSRIANNILAIPTFGIRRSFAKNFSYEFAFGLGLKYNIYSKSQSCNCDHLNNYADIQAKIGYNF